LLGHIDLRLADRILEVGLRLGAATRWRWRGAARLWACCGGIDIVPELLVIRVAALGERGWATACTFRQQDFLSVDDGFL